jgi:hypothetical protein
MYSGKIAVPPGGGGIRKKNTSEFIEGGERPFIKFSNEYHTVYY